MFLILYILFTRIYSNIRINNWKLTLILGRMCVNKKKKEIIITVITIPIKRMSSQNSCKTIFFLCNITIYPLNCCLKESQTIHIFFFQRFTTHHQMYEWNRMRKLVFLFSECQQYLYGQLHGNIFEGNSFNEQPFPVFFFVQFFLCPGCFGAKGVHFGNVLIIIIMWQQR